MTSIESPDSHGVTQCVEAAVDFSFRTAFRESCGLVNLLQIAGRVSRSAEYAEAEVWDFRHDEEGFLTLHPQFKTSRAVLAQLFAEEFGGTGALIGT